MDLMPRNILGDVLDDFFGFPSIRTNNVMKADIYEKDNNYVIDVDIPGFEKKDISVDYDKGYITIKVSKNNTKEEKSEDLKYLRKERSYGEYQRSFYVGNVVEKNIKANYDNGLLKITFPKESKETTKKLINIE